MRMNVRSATTASRVLNHYSEDDLVKIFRTYGELGNAGALAAAIGRRRKERELVTTRDLEETLKRFIPRGQPSKFLAKVYQALRIEVNAEMESLREMLLQTSGCMAQGGRLVVITYHSIEDRLVKNFMRSGNLEGVLEKDFYGRPRTPWKLVNRNVITPSDEELALNNRARSAKLRIAERLNDG